MFLFIVSIVLAVTFPLMNPSFRSSVTSGTLLEICHNLSIIAPALNKPLHLLLCSPLDSPVSFVRDEENTNINVC